MNGETRNYDNYHQTMKKISLLGSTIALLSWDQETNLPQEGAQFRAEQISLLAGEAHDQFTNKNFGALLSSLKSQAGLEDRQAGNIGWSLSDFEKRSKLPVAFVEEQSRLVSEAYQGWAGARKTGSFKDFAPFLEKLVASKRKEAEYLGYTDHPYDALLDTYEPGLTAKRCEAIFTEAREGLAPILDFIRKRPQVEDGFLRQNFPKNDQWEFGLKLLSQMGYDFNRGRQDVTIHPFTTTLGPGDIRITTRIDEQDFNTMTWSCLHEGGHALYEQGLRQEEFGLPSGEAASLGIHESQSRLWENNVGRSLDYWSANFPLLQSFFPKQFEKVTPEMFFRAVNKVEPSLVRVEADELTYHFHVIIRFEMEKALMEGSLSVVEAEQAWNQKYKQYLGVEPPATGVTGILQDIHWSHGSFGYFPTYSIGSFYAAQFYAAAEKAIPDLAGKIRAGELQPLLDWLREKVHDHGRLMLPEDLCRAITGEPLSFRYFQQYAKEKFEAVYG